MYPDFENDGPYKAPANQGQPKAPQAPKPKKSYFSKEIQEAIFQTQSKFPQLSVKPYLSSYEILMNLTVKPPINQLPIKIVFMQKYPQERPYVYVTKPYSHNSINELTGEVKFEDFFKWNPRVRIPELIQKLQAALSNGLAEDKFLAYLDGYKKRLEQYSKDINNLTQQPIPPNPAENYVNSLNIPQPPALDFAYVFRQKEFQEQLQNNCESNNQIYQTLLNDYRENESKAQYVSERFGKGRILKEMEAAADSSEPDTSIVGIENQLNDFFQKRKNYHRIEILKQKYLEI